MHANRSHERLAHHRQGALLGALATPLTLGVGTRASAEPIADEFVAPSTPSPSADPRPSYPRPSLDPPSGAPRRKPPTGVLRIIVEPTVDDASLLKKWIDERNTHVTSRLRSSGDHEQWISIAIGGTTYAYDVTIVAMRDGKPVGAVGRPLRCECNNDQLLDLLDQRIDAAAEEIAQATNEPSPPPCVHEPIVPERSDARPRTLRPPQYVGIAATVLGVTAVGLGVQLLSRPNERRGSLGHDGSYFVTTRPPGVALVVAGGAAVAGGIALLVAGVVRSSNRPPTITPAVGSKHAGLSLGRRF